MAKVKVRVLNAVVDGKGAGSELTIDEATAKALVSNGYVELVVEKAVKKEVADESALEATKSSNRKSPQKGKEEK